MCFRCSHSDCLLLAKYTIFLVITLLLELSVIVFSVVFQDKLIHELRTEVGGRLKREYGPASSFTDAIDLAQTKVCTFFALVDQVKSVSVFVFPHVWWWWWLLPIYYSSSVVEYIRRSIMLIHRFGHRPTRWTI